MMSASNIHFEMAERSRALNYGGIGAMHLMGQKLGLAQRIPDPTTSGDFTRRFDQDSVLALMEAINATPSAGLERAASGFPVAGFY
jgi:hypothetical protein